jgi:uncharacterized protein YdeI (BOF family)
MPTPVPTATPDPTPSPTTAPTSIAVARALPDGSLVTVSGVLSTALGALEGGRTAFIQDETGGIALYLDAAVVSPLPAGTVVMASGVIDERYAQRTLRVAESDLVLLGASGLPPATDASTGAAIEALEGTRIRVSGLIVGSPDSLADGSAISVDDGSGPVRVIVTPAALGGRTLESGSVATAVGPLGQRDSTGTGASGYRVYVTLTDGLTIEPPATPSPTQTLSPTPGPTSSPSPTEDQGVSPTPTASPTPSSSPPSPTPSSTSSPTPTSSAMTIVAARSLPVGSTVSVRGVVSAEAGRLGTPALFAIADDTGGIVVKLPDGLAPPGRGRIVEVRGSLADPYGQLEIRPAATDLSVGATGDLPAPVALPASGPGETTEGRLVRIDGLVVVRPQKATSGDIGLTIETTNGTRVRIMADTSSGVGTSAFAMDARYRITGIAGQRASKKGVPDGYRIWVRDAADIDLLAGPPPGPSSSPSGGTQQPKSPATVSIAAALRATDRDIAIDAVVTAPATLLDASGRRIVVQDGSGAVEILLPKDVKAPTVGARVHAIGRIGSAYGAPRLRASAVERRGSGSVPAPLRIAGPLTAAHTWRLVSLGGRVEDVKKLGDRWRAEVVVGAQRLVVVGQPGSRIPSSALVEGRTAEVIGIVRPAYPSASDRRPSVLPRSAGDIRLGAATAATGSNASAGSPGPSTAPGSTSVSANVPAAPDANLVDLAAHLDQVVRVGGLVVDLGRTGFTLDDGSATGRIELIGPAADLLALIEPDDAINVVGLVRTVEGGEVAVVVDDPGAITLGSALDGNVAATASDDSSGAALTAPHVVAAGLAADQGWLPGAGAGLAGLLGIGVASVVAAVVRRRHGRHLLTGQIAVRLAALGGPRDASRDPTTT